MYLVNILICDSVTVKIQVATSRDTRDYPSPHSLPSPFQLAQDELLINSFGMRGMFSVACTNITEIRLKVGSPLGSESDIYVFPLITIIQPLFCLMSSLSASNPVTALHASLF